MRYCSQKTGHYRIDILTTKKLEAFFTSDTVGWKLLTFCSFRSSLKQLYFYNYTSM